MVSRSKAPPSMFTVNAELAAFHPSRLGRQGWPLQQIYMLSKLTKRAQEGREKGTEGSRGSLGCTWLADCGCACALTLALCSSAWHVGRSNPLRHVLRQGLPSAGWLTSWSSAWSCRAQ